MPEQPTIHERIADILSGQDVIAPTLIGHNNQTLSYLSAAALAEVLVSELGLTAEWALTSGGGRQTVMSERAAKDKAQRWPESFGVASRYVTKWQDQ